MRKLLNAWNEENKYLHAASLKALMIMPMLLLQKPSYKSTSKQHTECLKRRMHWWYEGSFDNLTREARAIQSIVSSPKAKKYDPDGLSKKFSNHVLSGNINAALRLLDKVSSNGVLQLTPDTLKNLKKKHPSSVSQNKKILILLMILSSSKVLMKRPSPKLPYEPKGQLDLRE